MASFFGTNFGGNFELGPQILVTIKKDIMVEMIPKVDIMVEMIPKADIIVDYDP